MFPQTREWLCAAGAQPNSTHVTSGGKAGTSGLIWGKELGPPRPQGALRAPGPGASSQLWLQSTAQGLAAGSACEGMHNRAKQSPPNIPLRLQSGLARLTGCATEPQRPGNEV